MGMMWFGNEWAGLLTPDLCFDHCSGYNYFGLVGGNQCACGNDLPADEYKQDETYCDVPCVGDSDVPCGGPDNSTCESLATPVLSKCQGCPPMYNGKPCASTTRYNDLTKGSCGCGDDPNPTSFWTKTK